MQRVRNEGQDQILYLSLLQFVHVEVTRCHRPIPPPLAVMPHHTCYLGWPGQVLLTPRVSDGRGWLLVVFYLALDKFF